VLEKQKMIPKAIRAIIKTGLTAGREANVKASQIPLDFRNREKDHAKLISLGLFAASYKGYRSACLLLNKGYEESAIIVSRTIAETALQATFLKDNPGPPQPLAVCPRSGKPRVDPLSDD
jgi:hypothetical protein